MPTEDFLPVYDVSDAVAVVARTDAATAWSALLHVDLIALGRRRPLVGLLGGLRSLPEVLDRLVRRQPLPPRPQRLRVRDFTSLPGRDGGWIVLEERPGREIVLGLVGRFWRPVIDYAEVTADDFRDFAAPGYAKTVYALGVEALDGGRSLLTAVTRTATTDEHARRWFRRYWTVGVGSGARILATALLEAAREDAEARQAAAHV